VRCCAGDRSGAGCEAARDSHCAAVDQERAARRQAERHGGFADDTAAALRFELSSMATALASLTSERAHLEAASTSATTRAGRAGANVAQMRAQISALEGGLKTMRSTARLASLQAVTQETHTPPQTPGCGRELTASRQCSRHRKRCCAMHRKRCEQRTLTRRRRRRCCVHGCLRRRKLRAWTRKLRALNVIWRGCVEKWRAWMRPCEWRSIVPLLLQRKSGRGTQRCWRRFRAERAGGRLLHCARAAAAPCRDHRCFHGCRGFCC
jgi:hypothetical protein